MFLSLVEHLNDPDLSLENSSTFLEMDTDRRSCRGTHVWEIDEFHLGRWYVPASAFPLGRIFRVDVPKKAPAADRSRKPAAGASITSRIQSFTPT